jgi:hypothetical protein
MIVFTHHLKHQLKYHLKRQLIRQREGGRTHHKINHSASSPVRLIVIVMGVVCLFMETIWEHMAIYRHTHTCTLYIPTHTHFIHIYRHINPHIYNAISSTLCSCFCFIPLRSFPRIHSLHSIRSFFCIPSFNFVEFLPLQSIYSLTQKQTQKPPKNP